MKLYVTDQVSISAVQADTLKPGQSIDVSDSQAKELLKKLPNHLSETPPKPKAEPAPSNKAAPAPQNKMAAQPQNKSV